MYAYNPYSQQQAMAYSQDMYNSRQYQQPRPQYPQVIPVQWYRMRRQDTDAQWRRRAVRDGMTAWHDWEKSTTVSLKDMIFRLSSENEYGCCRLAERKLSDVESEISGAEDMIFDLESIEYNLPTIIDRQPSLAECYHSKISALLTPVSSVTDS